MKKRVLFLFACFITFILVFALQKPVFMLYNHPSGGVQYSDYLQVMVPRTAAGCHRSRLPYSYTLVTHTSFGIDTRQIYYFYS